MHNCLLKLVSWPDVKFCLLESVLRVFTVGREHLLKAEICVQALELTPAQMQAAQDVIGYIDVIGIDPGINHEIVAVSLLNSKANSNTLMPAPPL